MLIVPTKIDFLKNGRVVFYVNGISKYALKKTDSIERLIVTLKVGQDEIEIYTLTEIAVDGVVTSSFTGVDKMNQEAAEAKLLAVWDIFVERMAISPAVINVDAPVTVETDGSFTVDAPVYTIAGYSQLSVTDASAVGLASGVDDSATPVPIPPDATGAGLVVQFTSTDAEMRFASNGMTPTATHGEYCVENKTEIFLGQTPQSNDPVSELAAFLAIMNATKTAEVLITYYKRA